MRKRASFCPWNPDLRASLRTHSRSRDAPPAPRKTSTRASIDAWPRTKRAWDPAKAYAESKLHVVALAFALARRWPDVLSNAVDPGWVRTKMGGAGAPVDIETGQRTQAWLAVSEDSAAKVSGRVFNVGAGSPVSIRDLLDALGEILSRKIAASFEPARPGDVPHSHADIRSARAALRYEPAVSFREGLKRTVSQLRVP